MDLCQTFRSIAYFTWDKLSQAKSLGCHISEESFTDFNLLEIKSRHPKEVITQTFTKRKESQEGGDWEWWFRGKNDWLGFRIQAKVINLRTNKFDHLHYKLKNGTYQSELLVHRSLRSQIPLIPLYCLYSYWDYSTYPDFYKYTRSKGASEAFGCSIVDAFAILTLKGDNEKNHLTDLFNFIYPWSFLVCKSSYKKDDIVTQAFSTWKKNIFKPENINLYRETDLQLFDSLQLMNSLKPCDRPPSYVIQLLEVGQIPEPPDPDIKSITLFLQE